MLLAMFSIVSSFAQSASTYGFLNTTGTYTDNSAGATTIAGVRADTFISTAQNIGFTFVYEGVNYTQFKMSSNGFISLNTAGTSSLSTNDFSTANATSRPIIAPLWDDLDGATPASSLASYELTGAAPNRVLTVEWKNWEWNWNSATPVISFQVKLYETSNVIEFIYRQEATAVNSGSASIGIGSATGSGAGSYLNLTSVSSPAVSSSISTTTINTKPATNQVFRFSPPTPCAGTPVAGSVTPATQNICTGSTPASLVASGYTTGATGISFQWEESNDNGVGDAWAPAVGGSGATTATYTPPAFSGTPIYYRLNVICSNSASSAQTASVIVSNPANPSTQITAVTIPVATVGYSQAIVNWTNGNGTRRVVYISDSATFTDPVNGNGPALTANTFYSGSGQQLIYDGTAATVTVTGLSVGTQYYIKAYEYTRCGTGPYDYYFNVTIGTNIGNFVTCGNVTVPSLENFATYVPGCWQEADNGNITAGPSTFGSSSWDVDGFGNVGSTGAARYNVYNIGANDWLMSPIYNIPASGYELKFDAAATQFAVTTAPTTAWEADDYVEVLVSTGTSNWTVLYTYNNTNVPSNTGSTNIIDLDAYAGQSVRFAFRAVEGATNGSADIDFSVDNFQVRLTPSCIAPTGLSVNFNSPSSVDLNWIPGGSETLWDVEYGLNGFIQGAGTLVTNVSNPHTLNSLTPNTNYQFYVRANCGASDLSTWVGPFSFTTPCSIYTVPNQENFSTYVPSCWQEADNGDSFVGPDSFGSSSWIEDGFANSGTTGAARITIDGAVDNDWILSPLYTIPTAGYELKFLAAVTQSGGTGSLTTPWENDDYVEVLASNGTDNWVLLYTYNDGNVPSNSGSSNIINLDAFAGQNIRFAFRGVEGTNNGTASADFFIDNFEIRQTPTVAPSCATGVTATPNATCGNFATLLSWNSVSGADGYKIRLGTTSGGSEILNNVDLGSGLTYNHMGIQNTTYYFTIIPYNTSGDAIGCTEVSYATYVNGCYCSSNPSSNDNSGITNVTLGTTNFPTSDVTYFDHSATSVNLTQGLSSNVQITFATGYTYDTNIWIDFNNDYDFNDVGELVRTGIASTSANPTTLNASFTMPVSAPLGSHKMRIGTADSGQVPPDPCYSGTYGVTLDFTVNIFAAPSCLPPSSLGANLTSVSTATLSWTAGGSETIWNVEYGLNGFTQGTGTIVNGVANPYAISSLLSNTTYQFYVQADCGSGNLSAWSGPYSFTTPCDSTNPPYVQDFESVTTPALPSCTSVFNAGTGNVWETASNPGSGFTSKVLRYGYNATNPANTWFFTQGINLNAGTTYRITYNYGNNSTAYTEKMKVSYGLSSNPASMTNLIADHSSINQNSMQTNQVDFVPAATGVYYFGFQAYSNTDQFNLYLDNINIIDNTLSVNSFNLEGFKAYPNPVKDVLNLSYTKEISKVSVHNLLGQEVLSKSVNAMQSQVDLSRLSTGTYLVKVTVDGLENTIKIVKE